MIRSFRHKGLQELFESGKSRKVDAAQQLRALRRLDALNASARPEDMGLPGFDFHPLKGKPLRFSVHVNGPWCITFGWEGKDAVHVDLEQYY